MDTTAISLCMENQIPLRVFGIDDTSSMIDVVLGKDIGTKVE
jgi:uridylate kinase